MAKVGKWALNALCLPLFFVGVLLLSAYAWVIWKFNNITLDIIIIQLTLSLKGVDVRYFYGGGLVLLFVVVATLGYGRLLWLACVRERLFRLRAGIARAILRLLPVVILAAALCLLEKRFELIEFFFPGDPFSTYLEERYSMPRPDEFDFPDAKRNLVILFVESMEWTYSDPKMFPTSMTPRLRALSARGVNMFGHRQSIGTEYSASGFRSLALGLPARPPVSVRNMVDLFFGRVTQAELQSETLGEANISDYSLLGILEQHGYDVNIFRAATASFSGVGASLKKSTRNGKMFGAEYFLENFPELGGKKQNSWGVNDSFLFDRAREFMTENSGKGPYATILMTVNSHPPGYYEEGLPRPYGDFRDCLVQSDILAADFIEWVLRQPFGDDTCIVVMGDHLLGENLMPSKVKMPPLDERHIMAFIINPTVAAPAGIERRLFATWDLPATILESIGVVIPGHRFGLGTSLYSDRQTLFEEEGVDSYEKNIKKRSRFSEKRFGW